MTARSASTELQRADEMRARILTNVEAWIALRRPGVRDYDPAQYRIDNDDPSWPFAERDPRAIELEYEYRRRRFWSQFARAGEIRLHARRCVLIARHLAARAL